MNSADAERRNRQFTLQAILSATTGIALLLRLVRFLPFLFWFFAPLIIFAALVLSQSLIYIVMATILKPVLPKQFQHPPTSTTSPNPYSPTS